MLIPVTYLRLLQNGDSSQVQNVAVPSVLFVPTPDSASLSRSSSSISPCPRLTSDLISSQHNASFGPVNVLLRNGTTVCISPAVRRSVEYAGDSRSVRQILEDSQSDQILFERDIVQTPETNLLSAAAAVQGQELLAFEVPLQSSSPIAAPPSSSSSPAAAPAPQTAAVPNHYSGVCTHLQPSARMLFHRNK
ncbi:unnamed protein product [Gongylonema pulchrum]|uniref:Uncharacterized protein n=1 Tax=Gongylonema pulchrum TaxID=637853 RepID=A0A183EH82_9BILA|nr:unnamed protein product [Gongylonema pulchrum]